MDDVKQAKALPVWGDADIPPDRNGKSDSEEHGFIDIIRIFIRTWPYITPQVLGYWREWPESGSAKSDSAEGRVAKDSAWSFYHIPPLVTLLFLIGPLTGLLPYAADTHWTLKLLLAATALMTVLTWVLVFVKGRVFLGVSLTLVLVGVAAFLFAVAAVDGQADNFQVGLVCFGCVFIWVLQYRIMGGKLQFRVRLGSHLVYYYIISQLYVFLTMFLALFTVDLLNQSILQAQPLTPFLANFILRPELAEGSEDVAGVGLEGPVASKGAGKGAKPTSTAGKGAPAKGAKNQLAAKGGKPGGKGMTGKGAALQTAVLTTEQRHGLKWVYIVFTIAVWLITAPIILVQYYYYVWIFQRINQDLRMALVERWHRLSLRYHGDHRVGDSVYRIYQDSAQVTAVIGAVMKVTQELNAYALAILFVAALDPILGLMALSVALLAIAWGRWFSPRMRTLSLAAREANSDLTSRVQETFAAIRVVKAYGAEEIEQTRFDQDSEVAFNTAFRVRTLIAVACVDDYIAGLPDGLDTVLSDRGGKLSTGERQRLSIARAVIKDAPILILDEPTAALDAQTEHRVLDRLAQWREGRAIFLITHRISTIQRADKILYLDQGEIVESGSHDELMQQPGGRYRSFVEAEARLSKRSNDLEQPHEEDD